MIYTQVGEAFQWTLEPSYLTGASSLSMQQDSTGSAMIAELKSLLTEKEFQLEKRDSLIRDQNERVSMFQTSPFATDIKQNKLECLSIELFLDRSDIEEWDQWLML